MSLKQAAQYLESQGRGNDSRLMHVSPRELQGLQALAKAKGGSLTINPQTGLPEAGFLEDVLPVAAAGAAMFFAPALAPAIGGAFGASGALATGIGAGLLAGGSSLLTQALSGQPVNVGKAATTGALTGLAAGAFAPSTTVSTEVPALSAATNTPVVPTETVAPTITTPQVVSSGAQPVPLGANPTPAQYAAWDQYLGTNQAPGITDQSLFAAEAAKPKGNWWSNLSGNEKLMAGLGGVTALSLLGSSNQPKIQTPPSTSYIRPYTFSQTRNPNWGQPGQNYYTQSYTAQPVYKAAAGGVISRGPVESMSRENAGESMYPMSLMDNATYAKSTQMPTSAEVVDSDYDQKIDPYTGAPKNMADGGYIPTSQAVQDYNKMLSERAAEEYLRNPMPAALMPVSQRQALVPTGPAKIMPVDEPQISQDINGLYQYYLGRQPSKEEAAQWSNQISGPVTPEMANYFSQFTGAELAKTGYKPQGPNPFLGQAGLPGGAGYQNVSPIGMVGTLNADLVNRAVPYGAAQAGLPQYTYNAATRSFAPIAQVAAPMQAPVAAPIQYDQYSGGAKGGLMPYDLGGYSDGGRLLKGPGDGMSDNIPATIANKQPARLADGEFVVPADVVSHLGNGSTDAGAKKLYAMMDKVRTARVGTKKQGKQIKAEKYLPT